MDKKLLDITDFGKSSSNMKAKFMAGLRERFEANRPDNLKPSSLNAGIIGYMADMYGNAVEDHFFHVASRSKEMFVTSAKFDDSMYMQASTCKMKEFFATPAVIDLLLAIPVGDIVDSAILRPNLGYSMLTLGGKTQFILDKFYYLLDYPVDIIVKKSSAGENIISCKYQIGRIQNEFSDIQSTYIPGQIQNLQNVDYYVFKVRAHQLGLSEYSFSYNSSSNATDVYEYAYEAQLAGFRIWHRTNENDKWELLDNKYSGVLSASTRQKFCYYRLLDKKIEISFSNSPADWSPALNDKFKVQIFETEGDAGNFEYSAHDVVPYLFQDASSTFENALSGIIPVAQLCTTTSAGGVNMPTIEDLRKRVIDFKASRETITSEADLKRAADGLGLNLIRHWDDILSYKRQFITFALIKDPKSGFILPGRTGELYIPEAEMIEQRPVEALMVQPGNVYQFWLADDKTFYNTSRFIAKQPENVHTHVEAVTNYYKMETSSSHNIEFHDNKTEKATIITFNNQELYFGSHTTIQDAAIIPDPQNAYTLVAFQGTACLSSTFLDGETVGRTIFVQSLTIPVKVIFKSAEVNATDSINILKNHEYKFIWGKKGWSVTDLGETDKIPSDTDGLIPTIDHLNIPKGSKDGSSFIMKNNHSLPILLNYFDYVHVPPAAKTFTLNPKKMVRFDWDGKTWSVDNLGMEGDKNTPTTALARKDWKTLYSFYDKYHGVLLMCPYLIKIFKRPYFAALYDVQCNSTLSTLFKYNNANSPEKFAISGITVTRKDIRESFYEVSCEVSVSDSIYKAYTTGNINEFPVKLKVELFDNEKVSNCFFELDTITTLDIPNKLKFSTILKTDNMLHQKDMIRIQNRESTKVEGTANMMPTSDKIYAGTGIIPPAWFIPFKSIMKVYVLYAPDTAFDNEYGNHILEKADKSAGFIITDAFETEDNMQFVTDVSNIFSTTLEVIKSPGIFPKYSSNVPMVYDTVVYKTDTAGDPIIENGQYQILHNIGDPVLNSDGTPVYLHHAGDDIIKRDATGHFIYDVPEKNVFLIKNLPLISMISMLSEDTRNVIYRSLKNITNRIHKKILPKLIESNQIVLSVYNTIGSSKDYAQGSKNSFKPLDNLNVSIEINVKFNDSITETDSIVELMKITIDDYMNNIVNTGFFHSAALLKVLREKYPDVEYLEFGNINGANSSVQTIKKVDKTTTGVAVPEYIVVGQKLDKDAFEYDGTVHLTPNITINTIL